MNSGKVRLNSGILERRHSNWDRALQHFRMARQIDDTYCEPDYWIGATLLQQGTNLELGLLVGPTSAPPPMHPRNQPPSNLPTLPSALVALLSTVFCSRVSQCPPPLDVFVCGSTWMWAVAQLMP